MFATQLPPFTLLKKASKMKKTGLINKDEVNLDVYISVSNTPVLSVYTDETDSHFCQIYEFESIEDIDHVIQLLKQVKKEYRDIFHFVNDTSE